MPRIPGSAAPSNTSSIVTAGGIRLRILATSATAVAPPDARASTWARLVASTSSSSVWARGSAGREGREGRAGPLGVTGSS